ncbi:trypsin-like peptidase domain-containing protein [Virgibacillus sp. NKC19-16]|uniref:S1C family serine protease n=1 Tax=Virgibacillus salidurans TaxID=2831673 RepID=UPI001F19F493|nr:trypsin-like peptidase domain-containing protein [Virgibacillus sp. NKC19-16]UJL46998.1 trypsin-like peptidase domain-containing protein [Virgibacillus sp. NKC19-16]
MDNNNEENKSLNHNEVEEPSGVEEESTGDEKESTNVKEGETADGVEEPTNVEGEQTSTDEENRATTTEPEKKPKSKKSGVGVLLGGIVGGLISAAVVIVLFTSGVISLNDSAETSSESAETSESESTEVVDTLSTGNADAASNMEEASEAVVGVTNLQQRNIWEQSENEAGSGSGIIYKKEDGSAYVVTNQHVIQDAEEVEVRLNDEEEVPAQVLGTDPLTDLAVLEIDGENVDTVANLGSSSDLQVGETVAAIGNPLGEEFANTVTQGIVSGLERSVSVDTNQDGQPDWVTEVIQTDAAINPGNSGGALVTSEGEVIGINSMKIAQQAVEGIGFAIPIDEALPIMEQLETNGEIERPVIGITIASLQQVPPQYRSEINIPNDVGGGMVVADVQTNSSADQAGLQQYDVITKINGEEVTSILDLRQHLYSDDNQIGDTIEIEYYRDGDQETVDLELQGQQEEQEL